MGAGLLAIIVKGDAVLSRCGAVAKYNILLNLSQYDLRQIKSVN